MSGVVIDGGSTGNWIGKAGDGNTIAGNTDNGVYIKDSNGNFVLGNTIGGASLGNGEHGVRISNGNENKIGGVGANEGNTISHNTLDGVWVESGVNNPTLSNSIYDNGGLGIDLGADGMTPNDNDDTDPGANDLQNYPILTKLAPSGGTISGILRGTPGSSFRIEVYSNTTYDPSGFGEGKTLVGSKNGVVIQANGVGKFDIAVPQGKGLSATATEEVAGGYGSTSEFGPAAVVDFLDKTKATRTGFASVANWETAFDPGPVAKASFHETDADRFHVRIVNDARTGAGTITATITTFDIQTHQVDQVQQFELTETPGGSSIFISEPFVLVSNEVDDKLATAGVADGDAKDPTLNIFDPGKITGAPLELLIGGRVEVEYDPATGTGPGTGVGTVSEGEIDIGDPAEIRVVALRTHLMRRTPGGVLVATVANVEQDFAMMNIAWAQANIRIVPEGGAIHIDDPPAPELYVDANANLLFDYVDINGSGRHDPGEPSEAFTDSNGNGGYDVGVDLTNDMDEFGSAEERSLIDTLADADANTIEYFVVNALTVAARGLAYPPANPVTAGLLQPNVVVVVGTSLGPVDFVNAAHELGHVLLNVAHVADVTNVMRGEGTDAADGVTHSKRLTDAQSTTARGHGAAGAPLALPPGTRMVPQSVDVLTTQQLQSIVAAAIMAWEHSGISSEHLALLRTIDVRLADLPSSYVGLAFRHEVWIDRDASGFGWFVDVTPSDDIEFAGRNSPRGVDLLTVIVHELGHVLGHEHSHADDDVMAAAILPGVRRTIDLHSEYDHREHELEHNAEGTGHLHESFGASMAVMIEQLELPSTYMFLRNDMPGTSDQAAEASDSLTDRERSPVDSQRRHSQTLVSPHWRDQVGATLIDQLQTITPAASGSDDDDLDVLLGEDGELWIDFETESLTLI